MNNEMNIEINIEIDIEMNIDVNHLKFVLAKYYNVKGRAAHISGRSRNSK